MVSNKGKTVTFRESIENQVNEEVDRILKEMDSLKFDANQAVLVLNSLNLPVPDKLRELVQIEIVPKAVVVESEKMAIQILKDGLPKEKPKYKRPDIVEKAKKRADETQARITELLGKGPMFASDVVKELGVPTKYAQAQFKVLKEAGLAKQRVRGWQGKGEWYLTSRPVTLEQVRDASLKVRKVSGDVYVPLVADELAISVQVAQNIMTELVDAGILTWETGYGFHYEKPKSGTTNRPTKYIKSNGRPRRTIEGTGRGAKLSSDKEVRQILAKAESMGAQTKKQGNDHIAVTYKGTTKIIAATPGDGNRSNREKLKDLGISV